MLTNNTNTYKTTFINILPRHYQWSYAKGYAARTRFSIVGVQDRDTVIEQSPNYYNRTFSVSIKVGSLMEFSKSAIHTMKCIGLFIRLVHLLLYLLPVPVYLMQLHNFH